MKPIVSPSIEGDRFEVMHRYVESEVTNFRPSTSPSYYLERNSCGDIAVIVAGDVIVGVRVVVVMTV